MSPSLSRHYWILPAYQQIPESTRVHLFQQDSGIGKVLCEL